MVSLDFFHSTKGRYCLHNNKNVFETFIPTSDSIEDAIEALNSCENYCRKEENCWGCSVFCSDRCKWNAIPECGPEYPWEGKIEGDISRKLSML